MAINNIWVFAQAPGGVATTGTLELLTKARARAGKGTAFGGGDAGALAASRGEHGATEGYATRDRAGKLP
ncbi:MAG: electron transfer flavoprotein subunit alpha/FixB family protein, partial [Actinomycetota bacterium]